MRVAHATMTRFVLAAAIASTIVGCVEAHTERCRQVCKKEAECAETQTERDIEFDARECAIECSKLEREREGRALVSRHIECVERASTCSQVLMCP